MTRKRMFLPMVGMMLLTIAGCDPLGPSYQHLDVQSRRLLAGASVQKDIFNSGTGKSLDINAGFTVGSGEDSKLLNFLPARVGGTTFAEGQTIETRFNTSVYEGSVKWRHFFSDGPVGYKIAPGFAFTRTNFTATSTTAESSETTTSPAFELVMGAVVRIRKKIQIEADITPFVTNKNFNDFGRERLLMTYRFGSHIQAEGGWTWLNADVPSTGGSSYSTTNSGPYAGIRFVFDKNR